MLNIDKICELLEKEEKVRNKKREMFNFYIHKQKMCVNEVLKIAAYRDLTRSEEELEQKILNEAGITCFNK